MNMIDFEKIFKEIYFQSEIFKTYFNYQDKFLSSEIQTIDYDLKEKITEKSFEEQAYWINLFNEFKLDFLNGTFPDIQNKASLIMLYNFFENSLKSLCKVLNEEFKTPIEFSELNGDDLVKCKKYLTKICGLNAKIFDTSNWKKIDCIRRLRNCAVHNFSDISSVLKMDGIIVNDFKKADGFVIVDNHFGILKKDFLMIILQLIIDFQNELTIELKRIQKLKMN